MELTDLERAEFIALAADTFDPGLWSEDEYPILKAAREEYEREQAKERGGVPSVEQPTLEEPTLMEEDDDEADCGQSSCPE
jgi:hypothetical protein